MGGCQREIRRKSLILRMCLFLLGDWGGEGGINQIPNLDLQGNGRISCERVRMFSAYASIYPIIMGADAIRLVTFHFPPLWEIAFLFATFRDTKAIP